MSTPANLPVSLFRGASLSVGIRVSGLALAFLAQVLISRMSGADAYGGYMYCFAWLALLLVFTRSGTDEALVRFLPSLADSDPKRSSLIAWSHARTIYPAWLLMLMLMMIAIGMYIMADTTFAMTLGSVAPFIPVLTLLWIYQARLRSAGRTMAAFLPNEVLRPLLLILFLLILSRIGSQPSLSLLLWLSLAATAIAVSLMAGFARNTGEQAHTTASDDVRRWSRTANHFFLIAICLMGTTTIDLIVVGTLMAADQTGHYAAAQRLSSLAGFGTIAINLIVAPMLPPLLIHLDGYRQAERLMRFGARLATFFVLCVGLAMWFAKDPLLGLFGEGFEEAGATLGILILAQFITAVSGSLITLMMMSGHERPALLIIAGCGALNLVLCSVLTLTVGLVGAAIAILITTLFQQLGLWILARQKLGIRADCF